MGRATHRTAAGARMPPLRSQLADPNGDGHPRATDEEGILDQGPQQEISGLALELESIHRLSGAVNPYSLVATASRMDMARSTDCTCGRGAGDSEWSCETNDISSQGRLR